MNEILKALFFTFALLVIAFHEPISDLIQALADRIRSKGKDSEPKTKEGEKECKTS